MEGTVKIQCPNCGVRMKFDMLLSEDEYSYRHVKCHTGENGPCGTVLLVEAIYEPNVTVYRRVTSNEV